MGPAEWLLLLLTRFKFAIFSIGVDMGPAEWLLLLQVVLGLVVVLLVLGVVAVLWIQLGYLVAGVTIRTAYRLGLYRPKKTKPTAVDHRRDRGFLAFAAMLRAVSRLVPGDPSRHPHTYMIPMVLIGVPTFALVIATLWIVPMYLFWTVLNAITGVLAVVAAFVVTFGYIAAVVKLGQLLVRVPSFLQRLRPSSV